MTILRQTIIAGWGISLAASAFADEPGDAARQVFAKVAASVVTVRTLDEQGDAAAQGSGVVVAAGRIATNCHVVQEAASLRIVGAQGEFAARWVGQDPQRDVCILAVDGFSVPVPSLRSSSSVAVGEAAFAVGDPLGFGLAVSAGLVSVVDSKSASPVLISSASLSPGSSGGGLFDRDGRLLGITTAILGTGQNLNLVLSSDNLDRLAGAASPPRLPAPPPPPERRWEDEAKALQAGADWSRLEQVALSWCAAQPSAAAAPAFLGMAQQELKRNKDAVTSLRRAIDLDEHYAFAWLLYASALKTAGQTQAANAALDRAEAVQPNYAEPGAMRGDWLRQDGRLDEASRQLTESIRRAPGRSYVWRTLGMVEEARGNKAAAQAALQTALRLGDANADVRQRLAQLLAGAGKADEASRVKGDSASGKDEAARTQTAIGLAELQRNRLGPAEDALRKAIALAPELAMAWSALGSVLSRSGRSAEAEKAYDQSLKLAPDMAETLTNRAVIRRELGHRDAALADVRRAIAVDADYLPAWGLLGAVQMDARNFREAAQAFSRIDGLGKASADQLASLGEAQGEIGEVDTALKTLARAEAIEPTLVRTHLATAKVLGRRGDIDKALAYLERALKLEPSNSVAWSSKGYALIKLGRLPEAVAALETAVSLAPEIANGWINLGEAQLRSRNLGRAIQALEKAVVLAPQAIDARLYLAQAYIGARLPAKSREQTERLLAVQPELAPALGLLAMSYLQEGNTTAARTPYLRLKAVAPPVARNLRELAIAGGLTAARQLPE